MGIFDLGSPLPLPHRQCYSWTRRRPRARRRRWRSHCSAWARGELLLTAWAGAAAEPDPDATAELRPWLEWLPCTQTDAAAFKRAGHGARRSLRPRKRGTHGSNSTHASLQSHTCCGVVLGVVWCLEVARRLVLSVTLTNLDSHD
jgi:hypothetical protein